VERNAKPIFGGQQHWFPLPGTTGKPWRLCSMSYSARLIMVLALTLFVFPAMAQNLLVNGDFDSNIDGWEGNNPTIQLSHRADIGSDLVDGSGPGAIELRFPAGTNGGGARQQVEVLANTSYTVGASVYLPSEVTSSVEALTLWVYYYDQQESPITNETFQPEDLVADQWTRVSGTVTTPPDTVYIRLMVGVFNYSDEPPEGYAYWDDALVALPADGTTSQKAYIVAGADTPGLEGTYWTTDGWISNLTGETLTLRAAFLDQSGDNTSAVTNAQEIASIPAHGAVVLSNLIGLVGGSGSGGIYLHGSVPGYDHQLPLMTVSSYTATPAVVTSGSYGQGIPAIAKGATTTAAASGAFQNAQRRTNVGLLSTSDRPITVRIDIVDVTGVTRATKSWTLQPYQHRQKSLASLGVDTLNGGTVIFTNTGEYGSFGGYLSTVDAVTGDAVFVAAQ
jgi:hypothetical protein